MANSSSHKKKRRKRRLPRIAFLLSALVGLLTAAGGALLLPGFPGVFLLAAGLLLLLPMLFWKKRRRFPALALMLLGALLLLAGLIVRVSYVSVGFSLYSPKAETLDLSGQDVDDLSDLRRMTSLRELNLSNNTIMSTEPLCGLTGLRYVDLTRCILPQAEYDRLRAALPGCLLLSEAQDDTLTTLDLSGRTLPGTAVLTQVFSTKSALRTVNLSGSSLSEQEVNALREQFPSLQFIYSASLADSSVSTDQQSLSLTVSSYAEAEAALSPFYALREVTLTGCAFTPDQLLALQSQHPYADFSCQIAIAGTSFPSHATSLDLTGVSADDSLASSLFLFPKLTAVSLGEAPAGLISAIHQANPSLSLSFVWKGTPITSETTALDLSAAKDFSASDTALLLSCAPSIQEITLPAITLNARERSLLMDSAPQARFLITLPSLGMTFSSDTETLDFGDKAVKDSQVPELMSALNMMPKLTRVDMFASRLTKENYDLLFDTYPNIFFGWTVGGHGYTVRTDITAFSTLRGNRTPNRCTWKDLSFLRYCKYLQALDLGHNDLRTADFLQYFPNLHVLILVDNDIKDISPIAQLTELEYAELYINHITDLTPLAGLTNLRALNLCHNRLGGSSNEQVVDPILALPNLERCWISYNDLPTKQRQAMKDGQPDVEFNFTVFSSSGEGWKAHPEHKQVTEMMNSRVYEPLH